MAELRARCAEQAADGDNTNDEAIEDTGHLSPTFVPRSPTNNTSRSQAAKTDNFPQLILPGTNVTLDSPEAKRPKADGIAFPFKLGADKSEGGPNASMVTLMSSGVETPKGGEGDEKRELVGADAVADKEADLRQASVQDSEGLGKKDGIDAEVVVDQRHKSQPVTEKVEGQRPGAERFDTAKEDL